ncbi:MAG: glycosyltransferase family protein [Chitinivibrionales bacterium]
MVFLKSKTFVAEETGSALKAHNQILPVTIELPRSPDTDKVSIIYEKLKPHLPACILSIDNAGYDKSGKLLRLFIDSGSVILNWYTDDPVLSGFLWPKEVPPSKNRIDFVTEKTWEEDLRLLGYKSRFLPLAADPGIFSPEQYTGDYTQDIAFTGSSSLGFMDHLLSERIGEDIEKRTGLINRMREIYAGDPGADLRRFLDKNRESWLPGLKSGPEIFKAAAIWMVGYLYRKDFVVSVSERYRQGFVCFGDINWKKFIRESKVSTEACYYKNLCATYRSTKINLNLNRIQVRTSFNQRVFDVLASGAFLLTEKRSMNSVFFNTNTKSKRKELAEFTTRADFFKKADYYLNHEKERKEIAALGRERVIKEHTYIHRLDTILENLRGI